MMQKSKLVDENPGVWEIYQHLDLYQLLVYVNALKLEGGWFSTFEKAKTRASDYN